jgi:oligoendopeptidase F
MLRKTNASRTIRTGWDLSVFYKNVHDPKIAADIRLADRLFSAFERKYRKNRKYAENEKELLKALLENEKMAELPLAKPLMYLNYAQDLDSADEEIRAKSNLLSQEFSKIANKTVFFDVALSKIDPKLQKKFLKSRKLAHFRYALANIFKYSKHTLTEPEEKLLSLKSLTSRGMWTDLTDKLQNSIIVEHEGQKLPLSKAMSLVSEGKTQEERRALHLACLAELEKIAEVAVAELNAIVTDKKINDELRGYKEPFDGTILGYENSKKSVLNLVKTVTDNFKVSQRFYKVKAKMLGSSKLYYSDRAAKVGATGKKIIFEESYETLNEIFRAADPEFSDILTRMAENGQIDAYPKVGKRGGAYCNGDTASPTMVLLNHVDNFSSHMTFAHEMGHAIHTEFSKAQPAIYQRYSTSAAEVASTLFESFAFYEALKTMTDEEKIVALHDRLQDDIQTIFRQIACFNFELSMHRAIRTKGALSKNEFVELMNKNMQDYLGPIFALEPIDGVFFVNWPHIRYGFYVYTYAFGQIISKALYKKYAEDKTYIEKIKKFLRAGGSASPEDIFKSIGIDVTKPDFFKKGIGSIEDDIRELERLVEKTSKKR